MFTDVQSPMNKSSNKQTKMWTPFQKLLNVQVKHKKFYLFTRFDITFLLILYVGLYRILFLLLARKLFIHLFFFQYIRDLVGYLVFRKVFSELILNKVLV